MAADVEQVSREEGAARPAVAYERADLSARRIALVATGVLAVALLAVLLVAPPFFGLKEHRAEVSPKRSPQAPAGLREPPQPRLQPAPQADLQGYTAAYDRLLGTYSWIDQAKGIAAIPLDRAMQIASKRGIPRVPPDPSIQLSQPRQGSRLTGFQGKVVEPPQ